MEEFLGYCRQRLAARGVAITQMDDPPADSSSRARG